MHALSDRNKNQNECKQTEKLTIKIEKQSNLIVFGASFIFVIKLLFLSHKYLVLHAII